MTLDKLIDYTINTPNNTNAAVVKSLAERYAEEKVKNTGFVKTINGAAPDENGNVEVEIPEGFSGHWDDLEGRPFYSEITTYAHVENVEDTVYGEGGNFYCSSSFGTTELPENVTSLVGAELSATINGTEINGVLQEVTYYFSYWGSDRTSVACGNLHLLDNSAENLADTGEDWCITADVGEHYPYDHAVAFTVYGRQGGDVTIESLTCFTSNTKPLDSKFIGEDIARVKDIPEIPDHISVDQLPEELRFSITTTIDNYAAYNVNFMGEVVAGLSDSNGVVHEPYTLQTKKLNGSWSVGNYPSTDEYARYVGNTAITISDGRVTSNSGDSISNYPADDVPFLIVWNASNMVCYTSDGSATMDYICQVHIEDVDPIDERIIPETIARVSDIPEGFSGHWDDIEGKPFGEEVVEIPFINVEGPISNGSQVRGEPYEEFDGLSARVYCSGTSFGELTIDVIANAENDVFHIVDDSKNIDFEISIGMPGYYGVSYAKNTNEIDGVLRVFILSKEITPLDPKYLPEAEAVADVTEAPTAEQFNALLASLRAAGYLAE